MVLHQNFKMENPPHQTRHEVRFDRTLQRENALPENTWTFSLPKKGTYHKYDNGRWDLARICSIAMRRSYHVALLHDGGEDTTKIQDFRGFFEEYL